MNRPAVQQIIRVRLREKQKSERAQVQLLKKEDGWHEQIRAKLEGLFEERQFDNFSRCGHEKIYRTCRCCGDVQEFLYPCSIKWCPRCQWKITKERQRKIQAWVTAIKNPKHIVTTQRNFKTLTRAKIRQHQICLAKLRRSKVWRNVRGGCVSVEITNEGRGWHLHAHWLVDATFVDAQQLAITWGELVGQEYAIVKVKPVSGTDFIHEVSKYLVKGSELATWPAEELHEFVRAVRGLRFFFAFGSMFKEGKAIREFLAATKPERATCECGERDFTFEDERQAVENELKLQRRKRR